MWIINDQVSQEGKISRGVPQGSIRAPILFLVYINDLAINMPQTNLTVMYPDDTSFYVNVDKEQNNDQVSQNTIELVCS